MVAVRFVVGEQLTQRLASLRPRRAIEEKEEKTHAHNAKIHRNRRHGRCFAWGGLHQPRASRRDRAGRGARSGRRMPVLAAAAPTLANGGIAPDLGSITYEMKEDVLWADGKPLTAAAVFTWRPEWRRARAR